jgi:hypothetical protein
VRRAPVTRETVNLLAELLGFLSAASLTWQSYRLVAHLRTVRDLRGVGERRPEERTGELAARGAELLEKTIGRWDAKDQWLVVTGLGGLAASFLVKMLTYAMA